MHTLEINLTENQGLLISEMATTQPSECPLASQLLNARKVLVINILPSPVKSPCHPVLYIEHGNHLWPDNSECTLPADTFD